MNDITVAELIFLLSNKRISPTALIKTSGIADENGNRPINILIGLHYLSPHSKASYVHLEFAGGE